MQATGQLCNIAAHYYGYAQSREAAKYTIVYSFSYAPWRLGAKKKRWPKRFTRLAISQHKISDKGHWPFTL